MLQKNILVVEDNNAILDVITLILESESFRVDGFIKGRNIIDHCSEHVPDVIVLDIMLPDIDGRELLKLLKSNDKTAHIPVLMISARYNKSNYHLDDVYADDFMPKPFNIDELIDKIYALLDRN